MITFAAQRKCYSLHVALAATPQSLTTDLSVSQAYVTFCLSHVRLCHFVAALGRVHTYLFPPQHTEIAFLLYGYVAVMTMDDTKLDPSGLLHRFELDNINVRTCY